MSEINVKELIVKRIDSHSANLFIKRYHYSGKVCAGSQLHFGVFYQDKLHGVMSFGSSLDKRKTIGLVKNTGWNEFLELNRLAFDDFLPKNSESRALSVAFRLIKKNIPRIKWILSYADACQCGDGTIYRALGFVLTMIKVNTAIYELPNKKLIHSATLEGHAKSRVVHEMSLKIGKKNLDFYSMTKGKASAGAYIRALGGKRLEGYQIRYIYFLDKEARKDLAVPELPYSEIDKVGAGMYKGRRISLETRKKEMRR